ncbi:MAG: CotH kinase family protein [Chitinophagales bacterium]
MFKFFPVFLLVFLSLFFTSIKAQEDCTETTLQAFHPLFDDSNVPRIDIEIAPVDLQAIFAFPESNTEYSTIFTYTTGMDSEETILENVGFRLRGNTSRNAAKKSFKVSFNAFETGRKFHGLEKMNLNGEHNDPSIIRAKLGWDILGQMDVIAARANHTELYINGNYYGLYLNVEHIDEEFLKDRYTNNDEGNLYKCLYPADLNFEGSAQEVYKEEVFGRRKYDLKTNTEADDYSDLAHFITVLNETSAVDFKVAISEVFDVDVFLRTLAADVFMSNWDGYSFNINNFYLYQNPTTNKFEYIAYDLDNTFGIDFFNIDWGTRNIYDWTSDSHNNVLTNRILAVPEFKNRYSYYLQKLVNAYAHPDHIFPIIDCLKEKIAPFAEADNYRTLDYGYSIEDFHDSYTEALGGHAKYGIKDYITTRRNSILNQLQIKNIAPIIRRVHHSPTLPHLNTPIAFSATIEDDNNTPPNVSLHYKIEENEWTHVSMWDDGSQNDEFANDGIYTFVLQSSNIPDLLPHTLIHYYITATDDLVANNRKPLAGSFTLQLGGNRPALRINEFMVSNNETLMDEFGEYDDWIEIYNAGNTPVYMGDKFLTDNLSKPDKWQLPDVMLASKDFLLIWADNQPEQGTFHADFKLNKEEDAIGLFDSEESVFLMIDSLSYQNLESDVSYGLQIDGEGNFTSLSIPSPNTSNLIVDIDTPFDYQHLIEVKNVYPNPFIERFDIFLFLKQNTKIGVALLNRIGQKKEVLPLQYFNAGNIVLSCILDNHFPKDLYLLQLQIKTDNTVIMDLPLQLLLKVE